MIKNNFSFADKANQLGLNKNDKVLIAYSGGGDSTFLLVESLKFFDVKNIFVAYVNYHDSKFAQEEEKIVHDFIKKHKLNFYQYDCNLPFDSPNFEAKARDIRYSFFRSLIEKYNLKGVLVAHQKNDDAETYLFQKSRNSLTNFLGLSKSTFIYGIHVFRPLLALMKKDIISKLKKDNIPYFEDPTNKNPSRFRDRIRMYELSSKSKVEKVIETRDKKLEYLNFEIKKAFSFFNQKQYDFETYRKQNENVQRRFLFIALEFLFPNADNKSIISLHNLCFEFLKSNKTGKLDLNKEVSLYKNKHDFFFGQKLNLDPNYSYEISQRGKYSFGQLAIDLTDRSILKNQSFPFFVRAVKKGDMIGTELEGKNAFISIRRHGVPSYIRKVYPALFNKKGEIVYLPFFGDKYIFIIINKYLPKN